MLWVMCNPSTADETRADPTLNRVLALSRRAAAATVVVVNLFALVSANPRELAAHPDPVGPENDASILHALRDPCLTHVVLAWGSIVRHARRPERAERVIDLVSPPCTTCGGRRHLPPFVEPCPVCFGSGRTRPVWRLGGGVTKDGAPRHPLYVRRDTPFMPMFPSWSPDEPADSVS